MIPKECKRLAEVDFPIAVVSKHSAREKKVFGHHPQMLNQWWARRPLAACRAMLLGLLLPDPCDPHCPEDFKRKARKAYNGFLGVREGDEGLRKALLTFIGDVADWNVANNPRWIGVARQLVKAAYPDETPLVVDPFAGGGSIPLEALRLGCDAFASDLNPVACLILKVMLEDIPRHGPELAEELRRVGGEIKKQAEKELAEFYLKDPDGETAIAYLWARTVKCESPNCGAEIPLARSFWLCKKANRKRALRYNVVRMKGQPPRVEFEVFQPKNENEVPEGTVTRAKATCIYCGTVLPPERVRGQLAEQQGGADVVFNAEGNRTGGARLLAVVTLNSGIQGRNYRVPTELDYQAVWKAQKRLRAILDEWDRGGRKGLCPVPDEPLPPIGTLGFRVQRYGILHWGDLFTARQLAVILSVVKAVSGCPAELAEPLSFIVTRLADKNASLVSWDSGRQTIGHVFNRHALPIVWDFVESAVPDASDHVLASAVGILVGVVAGLSSYVNSKGQVELADATQHPLPDETVHVWFTDPPYYDAVPYADLSDFFFVWMKRALPEHSLLRDPFDLSNALTPKTREAVQDESKRDDGRAKDRTWFEETMAKAFAQGRRLLHEHGVGSVVFAHKTTEGWEALLSGMTRGGWTITGSWPIATERPGRLRSHESAALATSVHLVCRPRPEDAPVGDWGKILRELPRRVGDWMERLQNEGIRGADLVFACIGPALEIFSRYRKVETADGREVKLAEYLEKVWEVVGRTALEQVLGTAEEKTRNGAAGAVEEDARLTALFLWTLQSTNAENNGKGKNNTENIEEDEGIEEGDEEESPKKKPSGYALIYDVVRRFAQPLGIHLADWEGRIIETKKGVVHLIPVKERAKQLFGEAGADTVADEIESAPSGPIQLGLFVEEGTAPEIKGRRRKKRGAKIADEELRTQREATTLDRVHAAMLLQASGRSAALRALLKAEQDRGPEFMRLANALATLYPKGSEEKRLLEAMLQAAPR